MLKYLMRAQDYVFDEAIQEIRSGKNTYLDNLYG